MDSHISAAEAARDFSTVMNRVHDKGETFIVERDGQPVCKVTPIEAPKGTVADLVRFFRESPPMDEEFLKMIEEHVRNQPPEPGSPWERY